MKNKLNILLFVFIVIISMCSVVYFLRFDILTEHDLGYFWGRKFLYPEHGRYFATYFTYLITDKIPTLLNIHVNDFQTIIVAPIKAFCIAIICFTLTYSAFLFVKPQKNIINFSFTLLYAVIFLSLFNCFYFFDHRQFEVYFNCKENAVFFEYIMALFYYILFSAYFIYYFVTKAPISKLKYYLFLIITFLSGLTLEIINIPIFMLLTCFMFYNIYSFIKTKNQTYKLGGGIYITYLVSIICYYIRPNDHGLDYGGKTLTQYFNTEFTDFLHTYFFNFILHNSILIFCTFIILVLIYFFNKENKDKNKRFIFIILLNIFILFGFYFMTFFLGHNYDFGIYFIDISKWMNNYKVTGLFFFLISLGYFTDNLSEKYSKNIKIGMCILALIIFHKPLLIDYYANFNKNVNICFDLRTCAYMCEKTFKNSQENEFTIHLPKRYEYLEGNTYFADCYIQNIFNSEKKLNKIIYDDKIDMKQFSEQELKELKFKNI